MNAVLVILGLALLFYFVHRLHGQVGGCRMGAHQKKPANADLTWPEVSGGPSLLDEIPDRNRIFLDEEAAQEARASEIPLRFLGFSILCASGTQGERSTRTSLSRRGETSANTLVGGELP